MQAEDNCTPRPLRLLDQLREALRVRHYSIRTEQAYVHWAKRYILFHGNHHPGDMGPRLLSGRAGASVGVFDIFFRSGLRTRAPPRFSFWGPA